MAEQMEPEAKRLFVAISFAPGEGFSEKFQRLRRCTCRLDRVNWINPKLFHLTVKFLGDTYVRRIPALCNALEGVSQSVAPFSFTMDKIGVFGSRYQPRVVWLGTEQPPEGLQLLHDRVEQSLARMGFPRTFGHFVCHLTLARIREIDDKRFFWNQLEESLDIFSERVDVSEMVLYESILQKGREPQYVALRSFPLSGCQR